MPEHHIDVTNRIDTWYVIFSPHVAAEHLNRWMAAATDEGCRHVYLIKRAGALGVMQIEATGFGCFSEYVPQTLPDYLLDAKAAGNRVFEWGIQWTPERMKAQVKTETLSRGAPSWELASLESLRCPVYIQPGYFSCVALAKVFMGINDDRVQKPRELLDYIIERKAQEV